MYRKLILFILLIVPYGVSATNSIPQLSAVPQTETLYSYNISDYDVEYSINGKIELISIGDGKLADIWENVPATIVPSLGDIGKIKSVHDKQFIYMLIEEDFTNQWTALQFDADHTSDPENYNGDIDEMEVGDDVWVFGSGLTEINFEGDGYAMGQEAPFISQDEVENLLWETILVNDTDGNPLNRIYELRRKLITDDASGNDVQFQSAIVQNSSVIIATNENHKTETSLSIAKVVIGGKGLSGGSGDFTPVTPEIVEVLDAPLYFFTQVSIGLFFGSFTLFFITVPSVFLMQKQLRRRRQ